MSEALTNADRIREMLAEVETLTKNRKKNRPEFPEAPATQHDIRKLNGVELLRQIHCGVMLAVSRTRMKSILADLERLEEMKAASPQQSHP